MIGEMCPAAAGDRPAVIPVFARRLEWVSAVADVTGLLERNAVRQFSVYGWSGARVGLFSVAGIARVGHDRSAAIGSYAGASPCQIGEEENATCVEAQAGCGLAVAVVDHAGGFGARPFGEDPDPLTLRTGRACVAGDDLRVDIDGDGTPEAFPVAQFLDPVREPADEVSAVARDTRSCEPAFGVRHALGPGDPKHWRGMDVVGIVDLDGDGRFEVIAAYHYADRRTWAIYSALDTAGRLELVGEAVPWPRP
jgi:hypothetical protein